MSRAPRFEVVRTDAGWHARFRAANGQVVWVTESYTRKRAAVYAIDALVRLLSPTRQAWISNVRIGGTHSVGIRYGSESHTEWSTAHRVPVVDERGQS